jgi:FAD/FMN-containing dehydrogenase
VLARPDHRAHHRADQLADCSGQNSESASQSDWKSAFWAIWRMEKVKAHFDSARILNAHVALLLETYLAM